MLTSKLDPNNLNDSLIIKSIKAKRPLCCLFELTYHCNFKCPMCYVRMTDEQAAPYGRLRTVDEWLDMAHQIQKAGILYLTLTGGECTGYPGFVELYRELAKLGFRITVMTNASYFSPELKQTFKEYPPYNVSITLYGGSNETYEKVTGLVNGLDKVEDNISFLQGIGSRLRFSYTVIKQNVRDFPIISNITSKYGLSYNVEMDIVPHNKDPKFSDAINSRLSPAQIACVLCNKAEDVEKALAEATEFEKELEFFSIPQIEGETETEDSYACIGSYNSVAILWNGDMQTCLDFAGADVYKPFEIGFEAAWQQLQSKHNERFVIPHACKTCGLRKECTRNCPARNFEGTKRFDTPDPYVCQKVWLTNRYRITHAVQESTIHQSDCH